MSQTLRESDVLAELDTVTGTGVEGSVDVKAKDDADLYANVRLASESQVTNDGGVSVLSSEIQNQLADHQTGDTGFGSATLNRGDTVYVQPDYAGDGDKRTTYTFMGPDGTAVSSLNSGTPDFSDLDYWKSDKILNLVDSIPNMSATDSASIGAAFVRNDSDTSVTAKVVDTTLAKADSLTVESDAASTFSSDLDVNVSSSGGSNMGGGSSFAAGGFIATNQIRGAAQAYLDGSTITIVNSDSDADNSDVSVTAYQSRTLNATNANLIESGGGNVGLRWPSTWWVTRPITSLPWSSTTCLVPMP